MKAIRRMVWPKGGDGWLKMSGKYILDGKTPVQVTEEQKSVALANWQDAMRTSPCACGKMKPADVTPIEFPKVRAGEVWEDFRFLSDKPPIICISVVCKTRCNACGHEEQLRTITKVG